MGHDPRAIQYRFQEIDAAKEVSSRVADPRRPWRLMVEMILLTLSSVGKYVIISHANYHSAVTRERTKKLTRVGLTFTRIVLPRSGHIRLKTRSMTSVPHRVV
jgi:hypothetical protein